MNCAAPTTRRTRLDRRLAEKRDRTHGHPVAQDRIQFCLRILHRSDEKQPRQRAAGLSRANRPRPTASGSSRPALKDMETRKILRSRRARASARNSNFSWNCATRCLQDAARTPANRAGDCRAFDALGSLAETARLFNYCRPQLHAPGARSASRDGRHPVLDQHFAGREIRAPTT